MTVVDERLDAAFAALADPVRRAIVARLAVGEASVNELAELFPLSQQSVSRHIGVLKRSGLITQRVDRQRRPCRLDVDTMDDVIDWVATQKRQWEDRLNALEIHLETVKAKEPTQ